MKQYTKLTIATITLMAGFCATAKADSYAPSKPALKVTCYRGSEKTVEANVDYVTVENGITSGSLDGTKGINLKPDTKLFSTSDSCTIEAAQ